MSITKGKWIEDKSECESPIFKKKFAADNIETASIDICGLGWFELYINGIRVMDTLFTPAVSTYEQLNNRRLAYPLDDIFVSLRIYYCSYEITSFLKDGENVISVQLGNGWFNQTKRIVEGDYVIRTIKPKYLGFYNNLHVYDAGENIAGEVRFDTDFSGKLIMMNSAALIPVFLQRKN